MILLRRVRVEAQPRRAVSPKRTIDRGFCSNYEPVWRSKLASGRSGPYEGFQVSTNLAASHNISGSGTP